MDSFTGAGAPDSSFFGATFRSHSHLLREMAIFFIKILIEYVLLLLRVKNKRAGFRDIIAELGSMLLTLWLSVVSGSHAHL